MLTFTPPSSNATVFVLVDMQEKLIAPMDQESISRVIAKQKILVNVARELQIPLLVTEQYPKGLGRTTSELSGLLMGSAPIIEKTSFSCFGELKFRKEIEKRHFSSMVLFGIETHVCIQQTAIDAVNRGFQVFLASDAGCSRKESDMTISIELMRSQGVYVTSTESVIFSLLKDASHPAFKKIAPLLR